MIIVIIIIIIIIIKLVIIIKLIIIIIMIITVIIIIIIITMIMSIAPALLEKHDIDNTCFLDSRIWLLHVLDNTVLIHVSSMCYHIIVCCMLDTWLEHVTGRPSKREVRDFMS